MPLIVPVFPSEPLYQERVRLEDRDFLIRFDWSHREQRFYMSLYDQDETALLLGIKVVANWGLINRHHYDPALPPGELIAVDVETDGEPPGFDDFGTRVRLFYYESTEDLSEFEV